MQEMYNVKPGMQRRRRYAGQCSRTEQTSQWQAYKRSATVRVQVLVTASKWQKMRVAVSVTGTHATKPANAESRYAACSNRYRRREQTAAGGRQQRVMRGGVVVAPRRAYSVVRGRYGEAQRAWCAVVGVTVVKVRANGRKIRRRTGIRGIRWRTANQAFRLRGARRNQQPAGCLNAGGGNGGSVADRRSGAVQCTALWVV